MSFARVSVLTLFALTTLSASADMTHRMIEVGAGTEASTRARGVNVLLRVAGNFASEPGSDWHMSEVIARFNADLAISPDGDAERIPFLDIDFTALGLNVDYETGGFDIVPVRVTRDVRLGNRGSARIDVVGIWLDGANRRDLQENAVQQFTPYGKFAAALLGYRIASLAGGNGNYQGFDVGSLEFEAGLLRNASANVGFTLSIGGSASLSVGPSTLSDLSAYAQIKADFTKFASVFVRASGRALLNSADDVRDATDFQIMTGATLNID